MRDHTCRVSVVLCTFNRAELLGPALDAVLSQTEETPAYEVLLVDNNSRDATPTVVQQRADKAGSRLRYVFEGQQGLSFARNAGIVHARGDIVAFTDDDIRVTPNWVSSIQAAFDAHPHVDCIGGRILPEWSAPPPPWLTRNLWVGALALQDYGAEPFILDPNSPVCLAGANLAFRKQVFEDIGPFSAEFGSRSEDTELMTRFWGSGRTAMYVPDITVAAPVPPDRLTKAYFRAWHVRTGSYARLAEEIMPPGGSEPAQFRRVLGIPLFAVRELARHAVWWIKESLRRREAEAFWHEGQVREIVAYMRESCARYHRTSGVR
jgi:glucosyl-dolichyl phosphate glucuronosyltransferase